MTKYSLHFDVTMDGNSISVENLEVVHIPLGALSAITVVLVDHLCLNSTNGYEQSLDNIPKFVMANRAVCMKARRDARRKERGE